jgi:hypothetical protein
MLYWTPFSRVLGRDFTNAANIGDSVETLWRGFGACHRFGVQLTILSIALEKLVFYEGLVSPDEVLYDREH